MSINLLRQGCWNSSSRLSKTSLKISTSHFCAKVWGGAKPLCAVPIPLGRSFLILAWAGAISPTPQDLLPPTILWWDLHYPQFFLHGCTLGKTQGHVEWHFSIPEKFSCNWNVKIWKSGLTNVGFLSPSTNFHCENSVKIFFYCFLATCKG